MPDYRFADQVRQTDLRYFSLKIGEVGAHLIAWNFQMSNVRLKAGRLTFTTDLTIPPNEMAALELENG